MRRKVFRVEAVNANRSSAQSHDIGALARHNEVMTELKSLRSAVKPQEQVTQQMIDAYKSQITEAAKLKDELNLIYEAINATKKEIATLHVTGFEGPEMARVTNELDAIVNGTERATEQILSNVEEIDQMAATLVARMKDEQDTALVQDMQERVIKVFEACNFQDLTGQRITKVVATLKFIETHILRMMEIWGGLEAFRDIEPEAVAERQGDAKLLNGPRLENEVGHASQDDIDALFA